MDKRKNNSKAWFISDRSGMRFPMNESVIENNGLLVHRSETDGKWSDVLHPLNNLGKYLKGKTGDPFPVPNARPDREWAAFMQYSGEVNLGASFYTNVVSGHYTWSTSVIGSGAFVICNGTISSGAFSRIEAAATVDVSEDAIRRAFVSVQSNASVVILNSQQGAADIYAASYIPYSYSDSAETYYMADDATQTFYGIGDGVIASARIASYETVAITGSAAIVSAGTDYYRGGVIAISASTTISSSATIGAPDMSNGTWITTPGTSSRKVPAGVTSINIFVAGGGGGGRFSTGSTYYGGGGGGGYIVEFSKPVLEGTEIAFTVGAGGLGAISVSANGSAGGSSSCDGMTALGGNGVTGTSGASGGGTTDPGGVAGLNVNGSNGSAGVAATLTGAGGDSGAGGTGGAGVAANTAGNNGTTVGGGGSSAGPTNTTPGNGANGGIKFTW